MKCTEFASPATLGSAGYELQLACPNFEVRKVVIDEAEGRPRLRRMAESRERMRLTPSASNARHDQQTAQQTALHYANEQRYLNPIVNARTGSSHSHAPKQ
jgi:hypothetical protein